MAASDDARYGRAAARLAARVALACDLDLDALDVVLDLVANLPDPVRLAELLRFCERAGLATSGGRPS